MARPDRAPGPFETEQQARQLAAVREVYATFDADPGPGKMTPHNHRMILGALAAAGVYLGAYDHRIAEWLANWEPQTVAVIAGWVQRAAEAGQADAAARDGPRETEGHHNRASAAPRPQTSVEGIVRPGTDAEAAP